MVWWFSRTTIRRHSLSGARRVTISESLALLRANPPDSYYDCERSSADSCLCFISIDQPRLSTSSDQLHVHPSGPQDMATDVYRQVPIEKRMEVIWGMLGSKSGRYFVVRGSGAQAANSAVSVAQLFSSARFEVPAGNTAIPAKRLQSFAESA